MESDTTGISIAQLIIEAQANNPAWIEETKKTKFSKEELRTAVNMALSVGNVKPYSSFTFNGVWKSLESKDLVTTTNNQE